MAIFRECKHSFQIVQALFGKSASTLVFFISQTVQQETLGQTSYIFHLTSYILHLTSAIVKTSSSQTWPVVLWPR